MRVLLKSEVVLKLNVDDKLSTSTISKNYLCQFQLFSFIIF